jgi:hypothetical protein
LQSPRRQAGGERLAFTKQKKGRRGDPNVYSLQNDKFLKKNEESKVNDYSSDYSALNVCWMLCGGYLSGIKRARSRGEGGEEEMMAGRE